MNNAEWGGSVGRLERVAGDQIRHSRHRREVWRARRRTHRMRIMATLPLAAIGTAILVEQITATAPATAFVALGIVLVVPLLAALPFDA